jgi:D-alanine-D-alanine ligase
VTANKPRVLVLAGGISHEREISLRSGRRVADALTEQGIRVELLDPDAGLIERLADDPPDVVWPVLHGAGGEDGSLFALLELLGTPWIGPTSASARLAWDKPTASTVVSRAGVAVPHSIVLPRDAFRDLGTAGILHTIGERFRMPVVVKPAQGGSAQGVTIVTATDDLPRAMVDAYSYHDVAVVDSAVIGTEIAVGVIDTGDGPVALPAVEIEALSGTYGFDARYTAGLTRFYTPARLDAGAAKRAAEDAITAHAALGLGRLSRVDFIVDAEGTPWFLEANVTPGLTETSLVPQALEAAGHDLGWIYSALVDAALYSSV